MNRVPLGELILVYVDFVDGRRLAAETIGLRATDGGAQIVAIVRNSPYSGSLRSARYNWGRFARTVPMEPGPVVLGDTIDIRINLTFN